MKKKYFLMFLVSAAFILLPFFLRDEFLKFKSYGLLGIFIINFLGNATIFLPAPAIASVIAGGSIYNPFAVAIIASLGAALGDMVGFAFGYSGKTILITSHNFLFNVSRDVFKSVGPFIIFIAALIPNPFFDAIGLLAGFVHYKPTKFFVIMLSARVTRNLILASFGSLF